MLWQHFVKSKESVQLIKYPSTLWYLARDFFSISIIIPVKNQERREYSIKCTIYEMMRYFILLELIVIHIFFGIKKIINTISLFLSLFLSFSFYWEQSLVNIFVLNYKYIKKSNNYLVDCLRSRFFVSSAIVSEALNSRPTIPTTALKECLSNYLLHSIRKHRN